MTRNEKFYEACMNNNLEVVRDMLPKFNLSFDAYHAFRSSCASGHIEVVRLMCESNKITDKVINKGFVQSCIGGHIGLAQYFVEQQGVKVQDYSMGFRWACFHGHLKIVDYLVGKFNLDLQEIEKFLMSEKFDNSEYILDILQAHRDKKILSSIIEKVAASRPLKI